MALQNKQLTCRDCDASFTFAVAEQEFFATKGLQYEPKRCQSCRLKQRALRHGKEPCVIEVICADCGVVTAVPFKPAGIKPVLCAACFHRSKIVPAV